MSFSINNMLVFVDSFKLLSSSLDSSVKNLGKDDYKYLSQESNNNALDLVKQKGYYPYEYMNDFGKFGKELPSRTKFFSSLNGKKKVIKNKKIRKTMKDYDDLYLK